MLPLEEKHSRLIEEYAARFGMPGLSHAAGQEWIKGLAETFAARWPNEGWGRKSAGGGRPISNESLARRVGGDADRDGRLDIVSYDLIRNAGAANQELLPHAHPEDIDDQDFHPVTPKDHLAGGSTPTPGPPPTPTPQPSRPFPAIAMPWDVQVSIFSKFREGVWPRDRVHELTDTGLVGDGTLTRGSLAFLFAAQIATIAAWVNANGNRAPVGVEWWPLADRIAGDAIAAYRRDQPTP